MGLLSGNTENQKKEIIEPEVVKDEKPKRKPFTTWKDDNE